jgi:hypothetical protein
MGRRTVHIVRIAGLLAGLLLAFVPGVVVKAADDYLSILEAEASDTGTSDAVATTAEASSKVKRVGAEKMIEPGLSFDDFEATLSSQYSGSNFLYVKLNASKRQGVYRFYQNDNRISSVREEIVRLLSSS